MFKQLAEEIFNQGLGNTERPASASLYQNSANATIIFPPGMTPSSSTLAHHLAKSSTQTNGQTTSSCHNSFHALVGDQQQQLSHGTEYAYNSVIAVIPEADEDDGLTICQHQLRT